MSAGHKEEVFTLRKEISVLRDTLNTRDNEVAELREEISVLRETVHTRDNEVTELTKSLSAMQVSFSDFKVSSFR